ncbi:RMD1 family protein [Fusibacter paucivorans]|uniref:RMD1 family protein n=1 Tax=Fusibacter paucivorans TaxID=76009 RepID=A0ABS5PVG3_9FIRM|nr:RMD1 family protein [Fusibacter paucivorans]MBS7528676.1 RMD1 family protein [Fusibacter paucivorans]
MNEVKFLSVKLAEKLDLSAIASVFNVTRTVKWQEVLLIDHELVELVLKRPVEKREVYLYSFGVATFVDFTEAEIRDFLAFIAQIQTVNYDDFAMYYDHYEAVVGDYGEWIVTPTLTIPFRPMIKHIAEAVAKSTGFMHTEAHLNRVMDSVEPMITKLAAGRSRITKTTMRIVRETIVFKFKLTRNLKLFERPSDAEFDNISREGYDWLSNHFELDERYQINAQKIETLKRMVYQYYHFNQNRKVRSLYIFEVFLLMLFPLVRMLSDRLPLMLAWLLRS